MKYVITKSAEVAALAERLANEPYITVDTEFLRDSTYYAKLCLIQVAGANEAVCIDPLADGIDLQPIYDLFADPKIEKVFHAARQDLEIFFQETGQVPTPLFDSQVAAMVCGYGDSVGYEQLVREIAKAKLDKSNRFTDWSRRPLSDKQIKYALGDVTHLRTIYEHLKKQIKAQNRCHWIAEEMAVLTNPDTYVVKPEDAWQRLKLRSTEPLFVLTAQKLAEWREAEAQRRNLPRNRVIKDDVLLELAAQRPSDQDAIERVRGLGGNAWGKTGEALLKTIRQALSTPAEDRPKIERKQPISSEAAAAMELLKVLLKGRAAAHSVATKMIATTADLEELATAAVNGVDADLLVLKGWRREVFGEHAERLIAGELALGLNNGEIVEFPQPSASQQAAE
ncbi:MAG: ribonuclease D [Alphaproteobacteria bacterium]|nr:ribonuclease D [Alphaproteobacteria bacterium SS10]